MKKIIYIFAAALAAASCLSGIDTYSGEAGVYFAMRQNLTVVNADTTYRESSDLPFIVTDREDSVFVLRVKILGPVKDYDRQVRVRVVEDQTTALKEDYEPLEESYVLEAGKIYGAVPVHFKRTPSLEGKERVLVVELVENDDFSLPIRRWRNSSVEYVDVIRHRIVISDRYVQLPGYQTGYFGPFSEKKMKLLLELSGLELNDFSEKLSLTYAKTLGQKLDRYLAEMRAKGTPVLEDDGEEMKAGDYLY